MVHSDSCWPWMLSRSCLASPRLRSFFSNVLDLMWGPNSERQELFMLSVTLDVTSAPVVTITHSSCFAVTFLTIPYRPMHVSCLTKHRSFRSSTYYGLHDIVLSYMGLSHIHMHMRIHACLLSIHGTRMLGPCMSIGQGMAHACKVHAGLDIERPTG